MYQAGGRSVPPSWGGRQLQRFLNICHNLNGVLAALPVEKPNEVLCCLEIARSDSDGTEPILFCFLVSTKAIQRGGSIGDGLNMTRREPKSVGASKETNASSLRTICPG